MNAKQTVKPKSLQGHGGRPQDDVQNLEKLQS
jgi:hypothetical protein